MGRKDCEGAKGGVVGTPSEGQEELSKGVVIPPLEVVGELSWEAWKERG